MIVRALFRAVALPAAAAPYDRLTLKIHYPAQADGSELERMSGLMALDTTLAPYPVVILLPGINVDPEAYGWLAKALVARGLIVVTYRWIAEDLPGFVNLTPGVAVETVKAGSYGTAPTCPALRPILQALSQLQKKSPLAGYLDLQTVILGGHSAGGTMALQSVHDEWYPEVKGVFAYAAHMMAATMLGYEPGTILPLLANRPVLLLGGSQDGVIAASTVRYGIGESPTLALHRTFQESIQGGYEDAILAILQGANHFTMAWPLDETTGRGFLEKPAGGDEVALRQMMAELIGEFIDGYVRKRAQSRRIFREKLEANPLITVSQVK